MGGNAWLRSAAPLIAFGTVVVLGCGSSAQPQPTRRPSPTPFPLPTLDADQVSRGRQVYVQYCASCHGANAEGARNWQQPDARGNLPPPPHDDTGHTWRHSDQQLAEIIRGGMRDQFNKTPELTMPPFGNQLSDQEIADVITYFKSLWSPEHRRFQEVETEQAARLTPSPGEAR